MTVVSAIKRSPQRRTGSFWYGPVTVRSGRIASQASKPAANDTRSSTKGISRQNVIHEIRQALHVFGAATRLPSDRFVFASVELLRFEQLELGNRLPDPCGEIRKRAFVIPVRRHFCACQTGSAADCGVGRELH